jgi:antirestriction protein ArdC
MVKAYKLKSKVKFKPGKNKADYNWRSDVITLRPSYPSVKDFLITVLHEIDHANDRKTMGAKKYEKEYQKAGEVAIQNGGDFHDDNAYEEKAEKWARSEVKKWLKKYK